VEALCLLNIPVMRLNRNGSREPLEVSCEWHLESHQRL